MSAPLGKIPVEKIGQDADGVNGPDMGVEIDIERPDLQERLDVLEGILDLGLVTVSANDLTAGKKEVFALTLRMVGDKETQAVQTFGKGDLLRLLPDRHLEGRNMSMRMRHLRR